MEIRSINIDFDNSILKINGESVNQPTIVTLPSEDGWELQKMFAPDNIPLPREECNRLKLTFEPAISNKL